MSKLKIALQKSGRLHDNSVALLKACGLSFPNGGGKLLAEVTDFPLEILFLRDDDIPQYVEQRVADIGIIGQNVLLESGKRIDVMRTLGYAGCRLSLALPKSESYSGLDWFQNKKIATSYPNILQRFFEERGISAEIEVISGSV